MCWNSILKIKNTDDTISDNIKDRIYQIFKYPVPTIRTRKYLLEWFLAKCTPKANIVAIVICAVYIYLCENPIIFKVKIIV